MVDESISGRVYRIYRETLIRFLAGDRFVTSASNPHQIGGSHNPLFKGNRGLFPRDIAAGG
jgi:hypothetical protein